MNAQALICDAQHHFALRDVTLPDPGPGDLTIRTLWSGVSIGTEFMFVRGSLDGVRYPLCTGYMATGVVEAAGAEVSGYAAGDLVYFRASPGMLLDGVPVHTTGGSHRQPLGSRRRPPRYRAAARRGAGGCRQRLRAAGRRFARRGYQQPAARRFGAGVRRRPSGPVGGGVGQPARLRGGGRGPRRGAPGGGAQARRPPPDRRLHHRRGAGRGEALAGRLRRGVRGHRACRATSTPPSP